MQGAMMAVEYEGDLRFQDILVETLNCTAGLRGVLLADLVGETLAIAGERRDALRAMTAYAVGVHDLGVRLCEDSGSGSLRMVLIEAEEGHVVLHAVNGECIMVAFAAFETGLGTLVHDLKWCVRRLEQAMAARAAVGFSGRAR